jgi:hypothetical protein
MARGGGNGPQVSGGSQRTQRVGGSEPGSGGGAERTKPQAWNPAEIREREIGTREMGAVIVEGKTAPLVS